MSIQPGQRMAKPKIFSAAGQPIHDGKRDLAAAAGVLLERVMQTEPNSREAGGCVRPVRKLDGLAMFMATLLEAEEAGNWGIVFNILRVSGPKLEILCKDKGDTESLSEIQRLRSCLADARAFERLHGIGSLMKPDHPMNIRLSRSEVILDGPFASTIEDYLSPDESH
ncbi:hypothetical protein [Azospirillum ramasamyi]|uniref:Uncharacterized protein n=1 Tax=Azospirillum ramasamyi TaxID=682998 RepID=A0A2U9SCF3_9PROT|nr:hypothetical protein [Azospirillum ramasamyi]AWU95638.1 hypothetical protein DM194_15175 [Azospirillum ramasamyi]